MIEVSPEKTKTFGYTIIALMAFAANSVLCRIALKDNAIDASSFTAIRLLSGIAMFVILLSLKSKKSNDMPKATNGNRWPALMLFLYAVTFSFAYVSLDTGTGALVLFGAVQLTMITASIIAGNRLHLSEWLGLVISFAGLVYLVYPSITTPSIFDFLLMAVSGVAWGAYSLAGRGSSNPLRDTALNFKLTAPLVLILALMTIPLINISLEGVLLAVMSGAFASALGYTVWYIALGGLSATEASVVQLLVPVIAAMGGVLFVSESITTRLVVASVLVLGGILTVVLGGCPRIETVARKPPFRL
ncbi:MAG: DMT family transporter [Mariprofundaceae bacterium]|nr:DMT family transporter [Mariprofundaceae bacterium]